VKGGNFWQKQAIAASETAQQVWKRRQTGGKKQNRQDEEIEPLPHCSYKFSLCVTLSATVKSNFSEMTFKLNEMNGSVAVGGSPLHLFTSSLNQ